MKKTILAAAILALPCSAVLAQSSVTVYGVLDAGLSLEGGGAAGAVSKVTGGIASGSRLGFKGTEDLGNGLSALFVLESGIQADTGASGQGGVLFGRQAYVGLGGKNAGSVTLGRQYSPQYLASVFADPFGSGSAGDSKNLIQAAGNGGRMDNSVKYAAPVWGPYSLELAYAAGEVAGAGSAGRQLGAALAYAAGPLAVRLAWHDKNNDSATVQTASSRNTLLAATYTFAAARLYLAYGWNRGPFSSPLRNTANPFAYAVAPTAAALSRDSNDVLAGVSVPLGRHTLLASWMHKDDRQAANQDASQLAVGYRYALSKRTDLYAAYARISNRRGASYTVGNASDGGAGDSATNLGIRHTF
ncbi:MAG: porin [Pseudomonadota bacterium]